MLSFRYGIRKTLLIETDVDSFVELTPAQLKLKACLFETINEIGALYPKQREKQSIFPFSFCLDFLLFYS